MTRTRGGEPRDRNPFSHIARLYDWEHDPFREDVDVYLALARRFGGPVLELACGTGRILGPLTEAGFACTGVDSSAQMLARARERLAEGGLSADLVEQDLTTLELDGGPFRTILFPLDGLGLLVKQADQVEVLARARRLASHDGRLVVDVSNGNLRGGPEPPEEMLHHQTAPDAETGRLITKWAVRRVRPDIQLDELAFFYDEPDEEGRIRRTSTQLQLRWFTRFELELLLERGGWSLQELYGSYALDPYGASSDRLLVVAAPR